MASGSHAKRLDDWLIVVPARLKSGRLTEKPLVDLGGLPLVVRVAQSLAPLVRQGATLVVATDAEKIRTTCTSHGLPTVMTSIDHQSGTDRCREAAGPSTHPYVMNVQCDEPFLDLGDLEGLAQAFSLNPQADIGTLVYKSRDRERFLNPNAVKCVRNHRGEALYFSRSPIPYDRSNPDQPDSFWLHIGIYTFRRAALDRFCALGPSDLESTEKLEQLRALEHGMTIFTHEATHMPTGIDTQSDLEAARARLK